ncbi:alpha/beta hydrolase [Halorussus gelatinilyticus]|uniref:Alpha/beta hydrolase n=1 Tax=Halorussus gelatinilyticus TaxID=2937524 RepID=A0A8U0IN25_9EURY|nr:alpha/beta hydrolase [Halorussus gelatinilyticus]UPW01574.1 alpha/beta hydrolase [Halorussus gelatinilyticus]
MPYADNDGVFLHYEVGGDGAVEPDAPVVLLSDAGYGPWQWGWQFSALAGPFEVVVPATRGTGDSDAPDQTASDSDTSDSGASESYSVETLAADLEAVLADHGARKAHLVGAGLGGMVALRYALDFSRARSLSLLGTSPGGPRATPVADGLRERLAADPGDSASLRTSLEPVAGAELLETDDLVERIVSWRRDEDAAPAVQRAHFDAMAEFDASDGLYEITIPALVCHGDDDRVVPAEDGRLLADGLPKGEFAAFPGEHLFYVERSREVNDELVGFLTDRTEE